MDLDSIDSDIENNCDNELPLSSIANILLPAADIKIVKNELQIFQSFDYQSQLNVNAEKNLIANLILNSKRSTINNLMNKYECDICRKIFFKRISIVKHFKTSLCFPESTLNIKSNSSKLHKSKNYENSLLNNNYKLVKLDKDDTYEGISCHNEIQNYKLVKHQVSHVKENNQNHHVFSKLNGISHENTFCFKKHKTVHMFSCHICSKQFSKLSSLKAHEQSHDLNSINQWNTYDKHLNSESSVPKHNSRIHNSSQIYECSKCSQVFYKRSKIVFHIFIKHLEDYAKYSCDSCEKSYKSLHEFSLHLEKNVVKCDVCPQSFITLHGLYQHYGWHVGINNYSCQYCPMTFTKYSTYVTHVSTHIEEKSFRCNFCDKWFPVSSNLNIHLKFMKMFLYYKSISYHKNQLKLSHFTKRVDVSTFEAFYRQHMYNKFHASQEILKVSSSNEHNRVYVGDESINCDLHKEIFSDHNNCIAHKCTKCYECMFCPKMCSAVSELENHIRNVHINSKRFECNTSETTFINSSRYNDKHKVKHIESEKNMPFNKMNANEEYKCDICKKIFYDQSLIFSHILKTHY